MKIRIDSNLILPGLERENEIQFNSSKVTLWMVLEELSSKSSGRVKYIRPSTGAVDPVNFVIEINGIRSQGSREDMEAILNEGDLITIRVLPLGGG